MYFYTIFTKKKKDENLQLNNEFNDLNLNDSNTWEWEFE